MVDDAATSPDVKVWTGETRRAGMISAGATALPSAALLRFAGLLPPPPGLEVDFVAPPGAAARARRRMLS